MTAICGIYHLDGDPVAADALAPVMHELAAFGLDASATWHGGPVALGCQMTWVTPESRRETLPWHDAARGLAISADARIDNREELWAALGILPAQGRALPDSRLILHAYARWGVDAPRHLLGDFAFAIWDQSQQRLFCARDILGVRQFYYRADARRFTFAGDMAGLLTPDAPLDLAYLSAHFRNGQNYPHPTHTFFAGIRKLARAHALTVNAAGVTTWAYWDPTNAPEQRFASDDEYVAHLLELLDQAVQARVRSAYPVGAHLSGGLDCTSVAVLAHRILRERNAGVTGFSWSPSPDGPVLPDDERRWVAAIGQSEGISIHYSDVTSRDALALRLRHQGRQRDAGFVHELAVRRRAAAQGIRVLISGWGGDEFISFNGRGYFADLLRRGRLRLFWRELALRSALHGDNVWKQAIGRGVFPLLPAPLLKRIYPDALLDRWHSGPLPDMLFEPGFMAALRAIEPLPPRWGRERVGVRQVQLGLLAAGHLTQRIEGWASGGGRAGITYAYPLLDRRIVEFTLGIPPHMFFQHGWKRYLYRTAMQGTLPDAVRWEKSKREPALNADRDRIGDAMTFAVLPILDDILGEMRDFRVLDGNRARAVVTARMKGKSVQGDLLGAIPVEVLVNPDLEHAVRTCLPCTRP